MQADFSWHVQALADRLGRELVAADIWAAFQRAYHLAGPQAFELIDYREHGASGERRFDGRIRLKGR